METRMLAVLLLSFLFGKATAQELKLMLPIGHTAGIHRAHFSPDQRTVVTVGEDGTARLWDVATAAPMVTFAHSGYVFDAFFNKAGDEILTSSADGVATLWSARSGKKIRVFAGHKERVWSAYFSSNEQKIITASADGSARIWNTRTGACLKILTGHKGSVAWARFNNDGTQAVTTSDDGTAIVWKVETGTVLFRLKGHSERTRKALFDPTGTRIVTTSEDSTAKLWDAATGALLFTLRGHTNRLEKVVFSPDGKMVLTTSSDKTARAWSVETGQELFALDDHYGDVQTATFSPDGSKIISCSESLTARMWDARTGRKLLVIRGHKDNVNFVAFSPAGDKFLTASKDRTVKIWDAATATVLTELKGRTYTINSANFDREGKRLALSCADGLVRIWDVDGAKLLSGVEYDSLYVVYYSEFSKDGSRLLVSGDNNMARLFDIHTGKKIREFKGHTHIVSSARFNSDDSWMITASMDGSAKLWDVQSGALRQTFKGVAGAHVTHAAISPDNSMVGTASSWSVLLFESQSGNKLFELKHNGSVEHLSFSGDGAFVAAASDSSARVWNTATGSLVTTLPIRKMTTVNFSPDGIRLLTSSINEGICIWDWRAKKVLFKMHHPGGVAFASFDPDGKRVVSCSFNNTSKLWDALSGKPMYTFFPVGETDYFASNEAGYYQASSGAAQALHYTTPKLDVIRFDQLDVKFNRPDKVLEAAQSNDTALVRSYRLAYQKRMRKLGIDTMAFAKAGYGLPEGDFSNRASIEYVQKQGELRLSFTAKDTAHLLNRFNAWVNEVPLFGSRGISLAGRQRHAFDTTIAFQLSAGINIIEASVFNSNGLESYRFPLAVSYSPREAPKPRLYFIGIGLDRYKESGHNLRYSVKDMRDLAKTLKDKYGAEVSIDTLFDSRVTLARVLELKQRLHQSGVNDKVVLAFSGHGLLSKDYDYYLSTYDVNFSNPEEGGLPYDVLEGLLDSIPARQKLMLIDACHSGEVDKEDLQNYVAVASTDRLKKGIELKPDPTKRRMGTKSSFELMQQLFVNVGRSTGATIISAAAGTQFALERGDLQNGVFTYSILEFMKTHAHASVRELKSYVNQRVPELTRGLQVPTSRAENKAVDWGVW